MGKGNLRQNECARKQSLWFESYRNSYPEENEERGEENADDNDFLWTNSISNECDDVIVLD